MSEKKTCTKMFRSAANSYKEFLEKKGYETSKIKELSTKVAGMTFREYSFDYWKKEEST